MNALGKHILSSLMVLCVLCCYGLTAQACEREVKGKVRLNVPKTDNISSSSNKICQQNGDERVCYRKNKETGEMELIKGK